MVNENGREQAEFNFGISYLNRLNTLFYLADESAMQLDVNQWMHSLMTIFRELSTEMTDEEIKKNKLLFKEINNKVQSMNNLNKRTGRQEINGEVYDSLHDAELILRKVLKDSGLQMKMKKDATMALE